MIPFAQQGVIVDGWSYIWAAYIITWATLGLYGLALLVRSRLGGDS